MPSAALNTDGEYLHPYGLLHTTNRNWSRTKIETDPQNSEAFQVCQWLYGRAGGFCKVGLYGKHILYPTEVMRNPDKMASSIGSRRYKRSNTVISVATYQNDKDGTQKNLLTINALCIDIDYCTSCDRDIRNMECDKAVSRFFCDILLDEIIPMPTYIEYGRNFRLVYVLDNPYIIPQSDTKRKDVLTFLRRVIQVISEKIQSVEDWGVDKRYKVTPYVRIPESLNIKWDFSQTNPIPVSIDEVRIWNSMPYVHLWDIEKLADTVLPELPSWYDDYKSKEKKKHKQEHTVIRFNPFDSLFQKRMEDLETLQSIGWDKGFRETMVYLYRLTAVQSGLSESDALDKAIAFNNGFRTPLKESEVKVKCKPSNYQYKYKNSTIREMLNLGKDVYPHLFAGDGLSRHDRYERDKDAIKTRKIEKGFVSKSEKLEITYKQIIKLHEQGMKQKDIANELGIPLRTIKRYYSTLRTDGRLQ